MPTLRALMPAFASTGTALAGVCRITRAIRKEPEMERQSVASSLIRSVGFDPTASLLEIEFTEPRRIYTFHDVPYSV